MSKSQLAFIVLLLVSTAFAGASEARDETEVSASPGGPSPEVAAAGLHPSLAPLEPFLGTWEIDAAWTSGTKLWSRSHFTPILKGRFIEVITWVRDGDGEPYLRYHSMIGAGSGKDRFDATSFNHDGTQSAVEYHLSEPGHLEWSWDAGGATIRESYHAVAPAQARWRVSMRQGQEGEWSPLMDGMWKKIEGAPTAPIDDSQFVASGAEVRRFEVKETIAAPPAAVFAAFSDSEAFKAAYGHNRESLRANIDLAIGGRYEWLFDGTIGSNGCQILSYVPNRLLSFTWNAPPVQAKSREKRTWVVVELEPHGEATTVRLTHLGFGEGADWDETYAYFQKAWVFVLETLKKNLEAAGG